MATKAKAKTVTVRVAVTYTDDGRFAVEGIWLGHKKRATEREALARLRAWTSFPYFCIVNIELPTGKVDCTSALGLDPTRIRRRYYLDSGGWLDWWRRQWQSYLTPSIRSSRTVC